MILLQFFETGEEEIRTSDHTASEKRQTCLSDETLYGIRMTGALLNYWCIIFCIYYNYSTTVWSFVELTRYLLTCPRNETLALLSERLSQDPLENYFGIQQARGQRCNNPTLQESLQNAVAIRAQHSLELDRVQGNCR